MDESPTVSCLFGLFPPTGHRFSLITETDIKAGCQIEASFISPELASELSKSSGPQLPGIVKSPGGNHYGYHGPYTPRPGKPYLKVGCDVLSEDGETILEILPSNASAVPFPEGRTWSHDYKSGLPAHLIDVSQHSLVIHKSDIEGWLVPDSTDVFPPPPEDLADVEARAPFRIEYANWLEKEQTVGSANWHSKHPQGLPFIPPVSKPIDGSWMDHLPDRLRTYAMTVLLTYLKDRDGWVDPTSVKNLISHLTPPSEEEIKLDDEIGRWLFDHVTSHFGVGSAHQTLRRQCGGDSHRPGGQIPVYKSGSSNTVSPVSDVIVEIGAPKGVEVVKLEIGKEEK